MSIRRQVQSRTQSSSSTAAPVQKRQDPLSDPLRDPLQRKEALQHQEEEEEMLQTKGGGRAAQVHQTAAKGLSGSGGRMPHGDKIQAAFGGHDVSGVQAHADAASSAANEQMGSQAYAKGEHVAFKGTPDLHTAAHEAAHVVQQRQGVNLQGGVGKSGDSYERNADAVADAVVQGRSAEGLLSGGKGKKK